MSISKKFLDKKPNLPTLKNRILILRFLNLFNALINVPSPPITINSSKL